MSNGGVTILQLTRLTTLTNNPFFVFSSAVDQATFRVSLEDLATGLSPFISASAGGADTQVQFNNLGALDGDPDFTYDNVNDILQLGSLARLHMGVVTQSSAAFGINSTIRGFLPPRMTTAQRDAISVGATDAGLEIYNTDNSEPEFFNGFIWQNTGATAAAGPLNSVQFNNPLGTFAGSSDFLWDDAGKILTIIGAASATTFNGIVLTTGGVATNFLDETGAYSVPNNLFNADGTISANRTVTIADTTGSLLFDALGDANVTTSVVDGLIQFNADGATGGQVQWNISKAISSATGQDGHQLFLRMHDDLTTNWTERSELVVSDNSIEIRHSEGNGAGTETTFKNIAITTGDMTVTDTTSLKGLVYGADYSANFINRSLVDKAYADAQSIYKADSSLTSNRAVTAENAKILQFFSYDLTASNFNKNTVLTQSETSLTLTSFVGDGAGGFNSFSSLVISNTASTFTDSTNLKGLEYAADYSTNFTDRSLVDKGYVDGTSIYTADGTLTGNREVTMAGNDLGFVGGDVGIGTASPKQPLHVKVNGTSGYTNPTPAGILITSQNSANLIFEDTAATVGSKIMEIAYFDDSLHFDGLTDTGGPQTPNLFKIDRGGMVSVGAGIDEVSAVFQINSTTRAFLPPRMTTTQRDQAGTPIGDNPTAGLVIFNLTSLTHESYNGTAWESTGGDSVLSVSGGTNINVSGTASDPVVNLDAAITGTSVNGVTLTTAGVSTNFLDEAGAYSVPIGSPGGADTQVQFNNAGLLDGSANFIFDGTNVTAPSFIATAVGGGSDSALRAVSTQPGLELRETDATLDNKSWDILASAEKLDFRAVNDANSAAGNYMEVQRTGVTIDSVVFPGTAVGIGGAPAAKLDIFTSTDGAEILRLSTDRSWTFQQEGTGAGTALRLRNTVGVNKDFFIDTDGSTAWRNTDGTTTFVKIDQGTGDVGFGTTNPQAELHISRSAGLVSVAVENTAPGKFAQLSTGTGFSLIAFDETGFFQIGPITSIGGITVDATSLTVDGAGDIGMGVSAPNQKLHVITSGTSTATSLLNRGILLTDNVAPSITFEDSGEAADKKIMRMESFNQKIAFSSLNDVGDTVDVADILEIGRDGVIQIDSSILMRAANTAAIMSDTQTLGFRKYYNYIGSAATVDWTINTADMIKASVSRVWETTWKDKAGGASVANPINIIVESGFIDFPGTTQISITTAGGRVSLFCDGTNHYTR